MKSALIAAVVAALVASSGTYAAARISGRQIQNRSIPLLKLTPKAVTSLRSGNVNGMPAPSSGGTLVLCLDEGTNGFPGDRGVTQGPCASDQQTVTVQVAGR